MTGDYDRCFYPLPELSDRPEFEGMTEVRPELKGSTVPCYILRKDHGQLQLQPHAFIGPPAERCDIADRDCVPMEKTPVFCATHDYGGEWGTF